MTKEQRKKCQEQKAELRSVIKDREREAAYWLTHLQQAQADLNRLAEVVSSTLGNPALALLFGKARLEVSHGLKGFRVTRMVKSPRQ
jgi:hypothetical protein